MSKLSVFLSLHTKSTFCPITTWVPQIRPAGLQIHLERRGCRFPHIISEGVINLQWRISAENLANANLLEPGGKYVSYCFFSGESWMPFCFIKHNLRLCSSSSSSSAENLLWMFRFYLLTYSECSSVSQQAAQQKALYPPVGLTIWWINQQEITQRAPKTE